MDRKRLLEECEAELRQLQEENRQLRQASSGFADLAERLMRTLEGERGAERMGTRRSAARHAAEGEERTPREGD